MEAQQKEKTSKFCLKSSTLWVGFLFIGLGAFLPNLVQETRTSLISAGISIIIFRFKTDRGIHVVDRNNKESD